MIKPQLKHLFSRTEGEKTEEVARIPLVRNELAGFFLTREGEVIVLRAGEPAPRRVEPGLERNTALRLGAELHGDILMALLPVRPESVDDCAACQGTGFAEEDGARLACRVCKALGWIGEDNAEGDSEGEREPDPALDASGERPQAAGGPPEKEEPSDPCPTPAVQVERFKPHDDYIMIQKWKSWGMVGFCAMFLFVVTLILALAAPPIAAKIALIADAVVIALVIWLAVVWPKLIHKHYAYLIHPHAVEVHKGLAWRRVILIPRSRLQHADVVQGPIERYYDLASLVLHTAGTVAAKTRLKGLVHDQALALSQRLVTEPQKDAPATGQAQEDSASPSEVP